MLEILGSHGMAETNPRTMSVREEKNGNGANGVPFGGGPAIVETSNNSQRPVQGPTGTVWLACFRFSLVYRLIAWRCPNQNPTGLAKTQKTPTGPVFQTLSRDQHRNFLLGVERGTHAGERGTHHHKMDVMSSEGRDRTDRTNVSEQSTMS